MAITLILFIVACNANEEIDNIEVSGIVLTGTANETSITTLEGTLQMVATINPTDATNKSVTWSVENGTGSATISETGLLSALTNGTVTVKATSTSKKSINQTLVITITNQVKEMQDTTLNDLTINNIKIMGFLPFTMHYVVVLSNGTTNTPTVVGISNNASATVSVSPAINVSSSEELDRTTTIVVTAEDGMATRTYTIVFEVGIEKVDLGTSENFAVLSTSGVSTISTSAITGDVGVSPQAASYLTGFSLILFSDGTYSTSDQVVGKLYASDYTTPTPSYLTTAVADMLLAYTDASGRAANYTELFSGDLSGKTITTGVYAWGTNVLINDTLTLNGNANDVFIFQISGTLTQASNIDIVLAGGVLPENIFWQIADTVSLGTGSHFEGNILAMTNISLQTGASINGRLLAQTAVTLDANTVVKP
jgi:hypothetical protein